MKKIYVVPRNRVAEVETNEGILTVTSAVELSGFDTSMNGTGEGVDYSREDNSISGSSLWDQGW